MKVTKWLTALMLAMALIVTGCFVPVKNVSAAKPHLNKTTASVNVGKTLKLKVAGIKGSVRWSSTDKSVATVKKGVVTGIKPGKATIKSKVKGKTFKCKVTVKEPWVEGDEKLTLYPKEGFGIRNSEYGRTITRDFSNLLTDKNYYVYLDGKGITQYTKLSVYDWSCFIATLPEELEDGEHTLVIHVDGCAEYTDTFTYTRVNNSRGCVCLDNGKVDAMIAKSGKWTYMSLLPGTAGMEDEIKIYIDDKQVEDVRGYKAGKLLVNGDGIVPLWISQEEFPIEKGSTHHVRIVCPGFEDFDEDVTFN